MKAFYLITAIIVLSSCGSKPSEELPIDFKLPKHLKEVSGMAYDGQHLFLIEDGGNENAIYDLDAEGKLNQKIKLDSVPNIDWEDLAQDNKGFLYIGDFGNNDNSRKDLAIYKIEKTAGSSLQKTAFYYPEQTDFPPKKKDLVYDCEAFFEMNGYFYLFTKNRSKDFDGTTFLYKVPNQPGSFPAQRIGQFRTCPDYNNCCITGAALSADQSKMVLLSHSKLWLFEDFKGDGFLNGKITTKELNHYSQKESVCFLTNDTLLISDEKTKKHDGNVYRFSLKTKP